MRKSTVIKQDIKDFKEALGIQGLPSDEEKMIKSELKSFEKELEDALAFEKKTAPKKTSTRVVVKKKTVAKPSKDKRFVMMGKTKVFEGDDNFCEALIEGWKQRKESAKKLSGSRKTKPVTQRVASNIASAVTKGIKTIDINEIKKNPKKAISKMERLEKAGKEFLEAYKDILGDTITQKEIKEEFDGLDTLIAKIKIKYVK